MTKKQDSFRFSDQTRQQLEALAKKWNTTKIQVLATLIDRAAQSELVRQQAAERREG